MQAVDGKWMCEFMGSFPGTESKLPAKDLQELTAFKAPIKKVAHASLTAPLPAHSASWVQR
jgi:hypothetical protein